MIIRLLRTNKALCLEFNSQVEMLNKKAPPTNLRIFELHYREDTIGFFPPCLKLKEYIKDFI